VDELYLRGIDASQVFDDVGADVGLLLEEATLFDADDDVFESIGEALYTFLDIYGCPGRAAAAAAAAFPLPPSAPSLLPPALYIPERYLRINQQKTTTQKSHTTKESDKQH
jgi:hypothetical protein